MSERVDNLISGTYEHNKIKTPYAHIIVEETCEKPYFEIEYYDPEKETTFIGYGSYDLSNVFRWLEENFEVEKPTADVAPVVYGKWEVHEVDCFTKFATCTACGEYATDIPEEIREQGFNITAHKPVLTRCCPNCGAKMDLEEDK